MTGYTRRDVNHFLVTGLMSAWAASSLAAPAITNQGVAKNPLFNIAFSSWCFHRQLWQGSMKAQDLPALAQELGVDALEWTAKTFRSLKGGRELMFQAPPTEFFHGLRQASDAAGIRNKIVNVGGPYFLASADKGQQQKALDFILQYVEPATILGADILRTELYTDGVKAGEKAVEWQAKAMAQAAEGLRALLEKTEGSGLTINIENHHGVSSQPEWLADLMRKVNHPRLGLTVDTNNFRIDQSNPYDKNEDTIPVYVDRYRGLEALMPLANWVSAKFYAFDSTGYEIAMEYPRIVEIILRSGYSGYISVEYEGDGEPLTGVRKSIAMLRKLQAHSGGPDRPSAQV